MAAQKIIIDCDPGQDDAINLLLAMSSPEDLDILGVTAVAGNVPLDLTQRNSRIICEVAGRADVRVYAGCSRPMVRDLVTAEHVHGILPIGRHATNTEFRRIVIHFRTRSDREQ